MTGTHEPALIVALAAFAALWIGALVGVWGENRLTRAARIAWTVGTLVFPVFGPIVWFWLGRPAARREAR